MRTRPAHLAATAVAALAAALTLTACTSASQDLGSPEATSTADATGTDDAVAALVPEAIKADGKLTVAAELTYAPLEFLDTDGSTPVGLDVDIATALAAVMGLEIDIQSAQFDSIIPSIGSRYEVGISAFTVNAERLDAVSMVSYFSAGSQLAVAEGNPAGVDPDNLCGFSVGAQTGTVQQEELEQLSAACPAGQEIQVLPYDSQATVSTNLVGGKLDAMYADSPVTAYAVAQAGGTLQVLGEIRDAAPYGVVVTRDDDELAEAVRAGLQRLMDDGTLTQIAARWGNEEGVLTTAEINPTVP